MAMSAMPHAANVWPSAWYCDLSPRVQLPPCTNTMTGPPVNPVGVYRSSASKVVSAPYVALVVCTAYAFGGHGGASARAGVAAFVPTHAAVMTAVASRADETIRMPIM